MSLRAVRSPLAPKMTMEQASRFLWLPLPPLALAGEFKILMAATFAEMRKDFNSFPSPK
jgi:hypothetical protein